MSDALGALALTRDRTLLAALVHSLVALLSVRLLLDGPWLDAGSWTVALVVATASSVPVLAAHKRLLHDYAVRPPVHWADVISDPRLAVTALLVLVSQAAQALFVAVVTTPYQLLLQATQTGPVAVNPVAHAHYLLVLALAVAQTVSLLSDPAHYLLEAPALRLPARFLLLRGLEQSVAACVRTAVTAMLAFAALYPVVELVPLPGIVAPVVGLTYQRAVETERLGVDVFTLGFVWSGFLVCLALALVWDLAARVIVVFVLQPAKYYRSTTNPVATLLATLQSPHPIVLRLALLDLLDLAEPVCRPLRLVLFGGNTESPEWAALADAALKPLVQFTQQVNALHKPASSKFEHPSLALRSNTPTTTAAAPKAAAPTTTAATVAKKMDKSVLDTVLDAVFGSGSARAGGPTSSASSSAASADAVAVPLAFRSTTPVPAAAAPPAVAAPASLPSNTKFNAVPFIAGLLPRALSLVFLEAARSPSPSERLLVDFIRKIQTFHWAVEGVAKLLVLSIDEDSHGTVQASLPKVLSTMVDFRAAVESLSTSSLLQDNVPSHNQTKFAFRARLAHLHDELTISLASLAAAYGRSLRDVALPATTRKVLEGLL